MSVVVRREITVTIEQTVTADIPDPAWLDTVDGQDWLDTVTPIERLIDVVDASPWVAADRSAVPA